MPKKTKKTTKKKATKKKVVKKKAAGKKKAATKKKAVKKAVKKKLPKKKAVKKKTAKKKPVKKAVKKTTPKKKLKAAPKKTPAKKKAKATVKKTTQKKASAADERRLAAQAAIEAAMKSEAPAPIESDEEEDDFDPAAFYAASGVDPAEFRPHIMRKERVDLNIMIRYRSKGPLVHQAELINLSKGGLCLLAKEEVKTSSELRLEIPLPHTSELFAIKAEVIWSKQFDELRNPRLPYNTGLKFLPMSLAKQSVINDFIQQRRDEIIMAKIGLDRFGDSAPVSGVD